MKSDRYKICNEVATESQTITFSRIPGAFFPCRTGEVEPPPSPWENSWEHRFNRYGREQPID